MKGDITMKKHFIPAVIATLAAIGFTTACSNNNATPTTQVSAKKVVKHTKKTKKVRKHKKTKSVKQTTKLKITINGQTLHAELNNSSAAKAFAKELPKTMSFRDFMSGFPEKIADLHHSLPTKGMSRGHEGTKGVIGYWSPDQRIVFYYGTESYYDGIHIIGKFTSKNYANVIKNMGNNIEVRINQAK